MARISTYGQDSTLNKADKVLGTDSATGTTKNYTIESILNVANESNLVEVFDGATFEFQDYIDPSGAVDGVINLNASTAVNSAFSAINTLYISINDKSGSSLAEYLQNADNDFIKISQKSNLNQFGIYEVTAIQDYGSSKYKKLTLTPRGTNGTLTVGTKYFVANYSALYDQDFSDDSVTEFGDVTSAGSGAIITNSERTSLNNFTTNGLIHADVVDVLTSTAANLPLSANQGKALKDLIDTINTLLLSDNVNLDSLQEVVDFIEINKSTLDSLAIGSISGLTSALGAKEPSVSGKGLSVNDFTTALLTKLNGIADNAEVNVQSNWNAVSGDAFIVNKPTDLTNLSLHGVTDLSDVTSAGSGAIITGAERTKLSGIAASAEVNVQSNWNESDNTSDAFIQNKPTLAPSTAEQNVQANFNETDTNSDAFIQNKPTIPVNTNTTYDLTVHDSGDNAIIRLADSSSANDDVTLVAGNNVTLTPNASNVTIDIDLSTGAVANGATTLTTGDQVFDYIANFVDSDSVSEGTTNLYNVSTNLSATTAAAQITINSSDGDNVVIGEATGTIAGLMSTTHHDKLDGIEASATADQTASDIRTLIGTGNSGVIPAAGSAGEFLKHDGTFGTPSYTTNSNTQLSNAEVRAAVEAATDSNVFTDTDHSKLNAIEASATADQSNAEIRAAVEAASDSNVFTDDDHSKLNAIEASATADQSASEIRTLLGTGNGNLIPAAGVGTTQLADDGVTYAKIQNVSATDRILGRDSSGAGIVEEITPANLRTMINVADGSNAYVHPNHSGDVTSSADGATTIAANAVTTAKIINDAVTHDKLAVRFTTEVSQTDVNGAATFDCATGSTFKLNADIGSEYTITLTNYKIGQIITIYPLKGNQTVNLAAGTGASVFNKIGGVDYEDDGSSSSIMQIECVNDASDTPIFFYSLATFASDKTDI